MDAQYKTTFARSRRVILILFVVSCTTCFLLAFYCVLACLACMLAASVVDTIAIDKLWNADSVPLRVLSLTTALSDTSLSSRDATLDWIKTFVFLLSPRALCLCVYDISSLQILIFYLTSYTLCVTLHFLGLALDDQRGSKRQ